MGTHGELGAVHVEQGWEVLGKDSEPRARKGGE